MTAEQLIYAIAEGQMDHLLNRIIGVAKARQHKLGEAVIAETSAALRVGSPVRISDKVRPTYLAGCTGVVIAILPKRVSMRLDEGQGGSRFGGRTFKCPKTLLELID